MQEEGEDKLHNYEMYKAEGDLHLMKGLLAKAVDNYTKVRATLLHQIPALAFLEFWLLAGVRKD